MLTSCRPLPSPMMLPTPSWMSYSSLSWLKKLLHLMTLVDRRTSCIIGWAIAAERNPDLLQQMVDAAPRTAFYFSDLFTPHRRLVYTRGIYTPMPDKHKTYRVEGMNAELRHYSAARHSRCMQALRRAVKLFVFAWNRRQLYRQRFPRYPAHLIDFACPCADGGLIADVGKEVDVFHQRLR